MERREKPNHTSIFLSIFMKDLFVLYYSTIDCIADVLEGYRVELY